MKQQFRTNPVTEWLPFPAHNHRKMELKEDFIYDSAFGESFTAPKGYVANGSSYPRWRNNQSFWSNFKRIIPIVAIKAFSWYPYVGFERNASIIHDWLCDAKITDSKKAHDLYEEMVYHLLHISYFEKDTMKYKMAKLKARIITWSVKLGGPEFDAVSVKLSE